MSVVCIVNPAAGRGRAKQAFAAMQRTFANTLGGELGVHFTKGPGDATNLAREAASGGARCVIAVGGDGTFSEAAAGVVASGAPCALALVHQGTGGDFRRSLAGPERLDALVAAVRDHRTRAVDVLALTLTRLDGVVEQRIGVNVSSLGMGGLVDDYVKELPLGLSGKAAYFLASLQALATGAAAKVRCEVFLGDERTRLSLTSRAIMFCNGRYFGGGMQIAPDAKLDDGQLDLVALTGEDRMSVLKLAPEIYRGTHTSAPNVAVLKAERVIVEVHKTYAKQFPLDVDGEPCGPLRALDIEVRRGALRVIG